MLCRKQESNYYSRLESHFSKLLSDFPGVSHLNSFYVHIVLSTGSSKKYELLYEQNLEQSKNCL